MTGKHTADHDKIPARTECFCDIARHLAAAVGADTYADAVCSIGTLDDRRELRIADSGHLTRGAHRAGSDPHLDDIDARERELFHYLARHHVAGHENFRRKTVAHTFGKFDESLSVAVGHVDANTCYLALVDHFQKCGQALDIVAFDTHRIKNVGRLL